MKAILKLFKWILNVILGLFKKNKKTEPKPQPKFAVSSNYLCQKNKDMANTGRQLCYKWSYKEDGQVIDTCQLIKSMNGTTPVFYTEQEVKLLTDAQYTAAFNVTKNYMQNTLGWTVLPTISEANKQNLTACPIDSGGGEGGSGNHLLVDVELKIEIETIASLATSETVTVKLKVDNGTERSTGVSNLTPTTPVGTAVIYGMDMDLGGVLKIQVDSTIGNMVYLFDKVENQIIVAPTSMYSAIGNVAVIANLVENGVLKFHVRVTV
jgi:hypothetical protein